MAIWGDFQGIIVVTRKGRGSKNWENGVIIYGCPTKYSAKLKPEFQPREKYLVLDLY